jgi:hypothetical protein
VFLNLFYQIALWMSSAGLGPDLINQVSAYGCHLLWLLPRRSRRMMSSNLCLGPGLVFFYNAFVYWLAVLGSFFVTWQMHVGVVWACEGSLCFPLDPASIIEAYVRLF